MITTATKSLSERLRDMHAGAADSCDPEFNRALIEAADALDAQASLLEELSDAGIRDQIRGSDLYSPTIKRAMEYFWARCDALDAEKEKDK